MQKDEWFPSVAVVFVFLYNELTIHGVDSNIAFKISSAMKNIWSIEVHLLESMAAKRNTARNTKEIKSETHRISRYRTYTMF